MPAPAATCETLCSTPLGVLVLRASGRGLRYAGFTSSQLPDVGAGFKPARPDEKPAARSILEQAEGELAEYFAGVRRRFTVPLDLAGTDFQLRVWDALLGIPYGATITYRDLAAAAEHPSAIRAAGAANGANPISIFVPCHRVVGSDGSLTGYAGGLDAKRFLIEMERSVIGPHPGPLPQGARE